LTAFPAAAGVVLAIALLAAPGARAQTAPAAPATPIVDEVVAEREGRPVTSVAITSLIQTAVGQPLSMRQVRETIAHLVNLNLFDDVQVRSEPSGRGGVRLLYRLVPAHAVDRIEFRGQLGLEEGDLRRAVSDRFGDIPRAAQVTSVAGVLRTLYRDHGYPSASVNGEVVESHDPDRATLVISVQSGPRPPIVDLQLTQLDAEAQGLLTERPAIKTGVPYDKTALDRELQRWTDRMHERGYYEARASHGVLFPPDGAVLSVSVTRGPHITVAFSGDDLSEKDRERLVPIRAEASADEDLLEDSARAIEVFLRGRGYRQARVAFTRTPGPRDVVITFDVRRGPHFVLGSVDITGAPAMTAPELREFLLLKEGEPFTEASVGAGVAALRNAYLVRGYALAKVEAFESVAPPGASGGDDGRIDLAVRVTEGPQTSVRAVVFEGAKAVPEDAVRAVVQLASGRPFSESEVAADRDRIDLEYRNRGYDQVAVRSEVTRAENDTRADVRYQIEEGPQAIVDRVIIVGNSRTKSETIERELLVKPGQPLGYSDLIESRVRLGALGLFRRVSIEQLPHSSEPRRDIFVRVEEADPTVIGVGGGIEGAFYVRSDTTGDAVERFEFAPRGFFQVGRRNLFGKNRSVNLFTRVSLRSRDVVLSSSGVALSKGRYGFNEYRVVGSFNEPRAFGSNADLLVTTILEQASRSSFNFLRREARAEAGVRLTRLYSVTGRYSLQSTRIFDVTDPDQLPLIDRLFPQVRLSTFAGSIIRDSRDDVLDTAKGTLVVMESDVAARAIGSEVGYIKSFFQGRTFYRLPSSRRTVVAMAARLGVAHGFPRAVARVDAEGEPVRDDAGMPIVAKVQDLPASERFFAGGDTTVRGFALDRLGDESTISDSGFPTGGNGLIVLNGELRVAVTNRIQGVGFLDAGNVVARASDLNLFELRPAAGFGIRVRSPVGPIRLDLGFKLDRKELSPGRLERLSVWHISIGQAF